MCLGTVIYVHSYYVHNQLCRHNYAWAQMCVGTIMSGHKRVWAQTYLGKTYVGTNVSGHTRVWVQTCLGTNVSEHKRVWTLTCVGTSVSGHKRVWAQTGLGTNLCGHNHVWAQTWWNRFSCICLLFGCRSLAKS